MNNYLRAIFFVFILLLFTGKVFCQKSDTLQFEGFRGFKSPKFPTAQNVFKSNLIPIFIGQIPICGELRLTYERMIWHNQSITLGASYNFPSLLLLIMPAIINPKGAALSKVSLRGGRAIFGYRFYPKSKEAPKGFFVGPYLSYNYVRMQERHGNGSYADLNYANASLICGYQAKFGKHIFFEFFGGLGYKRNFEVDYNANTRQTSRADLYNHKFPYLRNVKIDLQINLGYGF